MVLRRMPCELAICRIETRRHSASGLPSDDNPGPRRDVIRDVTDATPTGPGITRVSVVISDVIHQSTRSDGHGGYYIRTRIVRRGSNRRRRRRGLWEFGGGERRAAERLNVD